jgi:chromosomal replication initiation ATPase DnaA
VYAKLEAVVVQGRRGLGASITQLHFLDGKAGRGKTFLMHCLVTQFRAEGDAVLVVGTTGLGIVHYDHSRTTHSAFRIAIKEVSLHVSNRYIILN